MAGLLDFLLSPNAIGGGLLSQFVKPRDPYAQPSQESPLDTAQWPQGPVGAPAPQPPGMSAMAQAPEAQKPSYFESGLKGLQSSPTLLGGLFNLIGGRDPMADANAAMQQMGIPAGLAPLVAKNPAVLSAVLQNRLGLTGQTSDIKEFEYAKNQGFKGTLADWMANKRAGAGEYGLNGIWGTGPDGKPAIIQLGKNGKPILTPLPEGFQPNKDAQKVDLGTHWGILDPTTRQLVTTIPKDLRGAEAEKKIGETQGTARANLPSDEISTGQTIKQIDELMNHEGLNSVVGPLDQFRPSWMLGEKGRDALARYNQLKGKAFLEAYSTLRGGGAITEVEGVKAQDAMARMDRAQGEGEFKQALKDFRDAVETGLQKLKARAGLPVTQQSAPQPIAPSSGGWKIERVP